MFDVCLSKTTDAFFTPGTPIYTFASGGLLGRYLGKGRLCTESCIFIVMPRIHYLYLFTSCLYITSFAK